MLRTDEPGETDDLFQDVDVLTKSWNKLAVRPSVFAIVGAQWIQQPEIEIVYTGPARENIDWVFGVDAVTRSTEEVSGRVDELAAEWQQATAFSSSLTQIIFHPSFQRILALGPQAIPSILKRIEEHPVPWFYALAMLVDEVDNPAQGIENADDAVAAWRGWGRARGLFR